FYVLPIQGAGHDGDLGPPDGALGAEVPADPTAVAPHKVDLRGDRPLRARLPGLADLATDAEIPVDGVGRLGLRPLQNVGGEDVDGNPRLVRQGHGVRREAVGYSADDLGYGVGRRRRDDQ